MTVLALTKYGPLGASSRVRTYQFLDRLAARGVAVVAEPLLDNVYLERLYRGERTPASFVLASYASRVRKALAKRPYDLVWLEKELMPWAPGWMERGLLAGRPYIVDYDDAIFHNYDAHSNALVRKVWGKKIDRVMRGASLVIAGNRYLADRAVRAGARRIEVIPSVIDIERYGIDPPSKGGPFTVGWIGSPTSQGQLETIRPVLEDHLAAGGRITTVGATSSALEGMDVDRQPWSEATEVAHIRSFDVGIMPLTDTPWRRGKCGFKLIQTLAVGRPVIASPVGANVEIVEGTGGGRLAESHDEWRAALQALRGSSELRGTLGERGYLAVRDHYSVQAVLPQLEVVLRSALD